jgi:hypothetical protein
MNPGGGTYQHNEMEADWDDSIMSQLASCNLQQLCTDEYQTLKNY